MHEIASTFREAGLSGGFYEAAAEVFHRMANFKDSAETPKLEDVLKDLEVRVRHLLDDENIRGADGISRAGIERARAIA